MAEPLDLAAEAAERLGRRLEGRVVAVAGPRAGDVTLRLERAVDLVAAAAELQAGLGMALATLVATDDEPRGEGLGVRYVFEPGAPPPAEGAPLPDRFVTLLVSVDPRHPTLPSLTPTVPAANWHEREAADLFGIEPVGHPNPRPLVVHDGWPAGVHPLRKSFAAATRPPREEAAELPHMVVAGEGVFEIPVGPIHAGIIEPGHFRFSSVGETVLHLDARLFYTHRGLEKRVEGLSLADACFVAERLCGVCSVTHTLGFAEAAEQIAGVEVPARARLVRSIALELERLYNHVGDIGNICAGASYHWGTSAGARAKEALQRVNERLTGNRFLRGLVVPGGVRLDVTPPLVAEVAEVARQTGERVMELTSTIDRNPSVVDRLDGTGLLTAQAARDLGVTGVAARASGIDRDARRDHPHAAYGREELSVRVTTAEAGDVHARLSVRAAEAAESIRLVGELLARLEAGPIQAPWPAALPPWAVGISSVESPRGAAVCWLRVDGAGAVDRYHVRSASYANWPAVPLAALWAIVPDFPLVNKSFELCYSCTDR